MTKFITEQIGFETSSIVVETKRVEEIPYGSFRGGEEIPPGGWRNGEEIPPGGWRSYIYKDDYRTRDGRAYYKFGFAQVGSNIEIDILDMPGYGGRDDALHPTHRLKSERGGYKICFGNPSISNDINSAKKWAAIWAEHTWKYITTGKPIPNS
jgi:hypothetical protein